MSPKQNRTTTRAARWLRSRGWLACALFTVVACGAGPRPAPAPPCDQSCQDGVALLGLRTAMKLAYNFAVATKPINAQNGTAPCVSFDGTTAGTVHVFGNATVNALQGASIVSLSYDFKNCLYSAPPDPSADQNFSLTINGLVTENGTISVQPTATTALAIQTVLDDSTMLPTDSLSIVGTVYDPPLDYAASNCALSVIQNGNDLSGAFCGRSAGTTL